MYLLVAANMRMFTSESIRNSSSSSSPAKHSAMVPRQVVACAVVVVAGSSKAWWSPWSTVALVAVEEIMKERKRIITGRLLGRGRGRAKMEDHQPPTKLEYYDNMWKLESKAAVLSCFQVEDGKFALTLDSTIFHPQGGGQPADTGFIAFRDSALKFLVQDVRSRDLIVFHYGMFDGLEGGELEPKIEKGKGVHLHVNEPSRCLNSRLHSAGHLLDICVRNVGLGYLEPGKGYHFPDGPFVEYKGTIPQNELQKKREEIELDANALISRGGKVSAEVLPYEEAAKRCGGHLPDYIPKGSTPRIVKFGENPGCPCGGTHVADISHIKDIKVPQIRIKKGMTKVFYNITV